MDIKITKKQRRFIEADATEVLFGGAAGGGKSFGQLIDALLYALKYPKSKQLILRRTFAELEKSLIRVSLSLFPREIYTYNSTLHSGKFKNGSILDFGYCATENDVFQYQSAEYDAVRFDELTHFTEFQYLYLISRVRGANDNPKQIKSSTNPGGVGHSWVKSRFVDPSPPDTPFTASDGSRRIFIPSKIDDNLFLMKSDPEYKKRLLALPESQKKALLYGDWNIFEGQYFTEFDYEKHTCNPFPIPKEWRKYRTIDYGLDRLACLWVAVDSDRNVYVYRELCESNLMISDAAKKICEKTPTEESIYATLAPPDLWSRSQESGRSKAIIFSENGLFFTKTANDRETGWLSIKELLKTDEKGRPRLKIFRSCTEIIRCLPMLQIDPQRPTDTANEPHEITHAPDALRGFAIFYSRPNEKERTVVRTHWSQDMWQDYEMASEEERIYLKRKYGEPL
ncbi:MAG: terminase family protein [Clostridia bacterium]|nr:terminase family protein [Clostridia bacterium]